MRLIDSSNAEEYLRERGLICSGDGVRISRLSGGVSNEVCRVAFLGDPRRDFVLKQAREQLRVADPWFCTPRRIWREVEVLRLCERLLADEDEGGSVGEGPVARTPRMLFEDRELCLFVMEAAPRDHVVWKRRLLAGEADAEIAAACGRLLGRLHGRTWRDERVARQLADRDVFIELRVDPYYRTLARRQPDVADHLRWLEDSLSQHRVALTHGDFSPKNLLVYSLPGEGEPARREPASGLMMVDFETGHWGDPAFDLGFFLSHLLLKAVYHTPHHEPFFHLTERFWAAYRASLQQTVPPGEYPALVERAIQNAAACAWSRVDGKSPVEYLKDAAKRNQVRHLCRSIFTIAPKGWSELLRLWRKLTN